MENGQRTDEFSICFRDISIKTKDKWHCPADGGGIIIYLSLTLEDFWYLVISAHAKLPSDVIVIQTCILCW